MTPRIETCNGFDKRNQGKRDFFIELKNGVFYVDENLEDEAPALLATELRYSKLSVQQFREQRSKEVTELRSKRASLYIPLLEKHVIWPFAFGVIDGKDTRKRADPHFIQGGQPRVYEYIPPRTFVVEEAIGRKERPVIWLHEFTEYLLMVILPYDPAHFIADKIEGLARQIFFNFSRGDVRQHQPSSVKVD